MNKKIALTLAILLVASVDSIFAQNKFQIVFTGTCWTTNAAGKIVPRPVSNATLMADFAAQNGVTDTSWLALAYHVGGNELGDTIEVINRTNGTSIVNGTIFGLYFGEDFGRMALLSGSGKQMKRLEYVYTDQNSHSLGSALLTDYYFFDSDGHTNNTVIMGQMQYIIVPDAKHANLKVCNGSFTTTRPWKF
jgi:hypothetical protein